jgi:hypothetical protein
MCWATFWAILARSHPVALAHKKAEAFFRVAIPSQQVWPGLPDVSRHNICTKNGENIPEEHKLYQKAINYTKWWLNIPNGHEMQQHFPFQGPRKFTQVWIFGLKIYHLAALNRGFQTLTGFW